MNRSTEKTRNIQIWNLIKHIFVFQLKFKWGFLFNTKALVCIPKVQQTIWINFLSLKAVAKQVSFFFQKGL